MRAALVPVARQAVHRGDRVVRGRRAGGEDDLQRRGDVGRRVVQFEQRGRRVLAEQTLARRQRVVEDVARVRRAHRRRIGIGRQQLPRVSARRLEQAVAAAAAHVDRRHQRAADQRVERSARAAARDRHQTALVERAGEDARAPEHRPRAGIEPVHAPGDRGAQRAAPRRDVAQRAGRPGRVLAQRGADRLQRVVAHPRRGQLDRQRQAVERGADLAHERARRRVAEPEAAVRGAAALGEQRNRVLDHQRRDVDQPLAREAQRLARGRQTREPAAPPAAPARRPSATASTRCSQLSSTSSTSRCASASSSTRRGAALRLFAHAERAQHGHVHVGVLGQRRQVDEPRPVGVARDRPQRDLARQARLPGAARAEQRDQPLLVEQRRDVLQIAVAADEAGRLEAEVGPLPVARGGVEEGA